MTGTGNLTSRPDIGSRWWDALKAECGHWAQGLRCRAIREVTTAPHPANECPGGVT